MRKTRLTDVMLSALLLAGCGDASGTTGVIQLRDNCDPATFNATLGDGACQHSSGAVGLSLTDFTSRLQSTHLIEAWKIEPATISLPKGTTMAVLNSGGETHTYTEVAAFGGGVIPVLNQLSENLSVAPECADPAAVSASTVRSNEVKMHTFDAPGIRRFQCCIHPWMRQTVTVP